MSTHASAGRPLRVCHLAYTFYEADNRVLRYAETLADRGDRVEVIALRRPGQSVRGRQGNVGVFRIQRRAVTEKTAAASLLKILWFSLKATILLTLLQLRGRHDVVHVHNVPDFLIFCAIVPKLLGARIILDIHDILPELYADKFGSGKQSRGFRWLLAVERLSCRFADHVIVANHLWYEKLIHRAVAPEKCTPLMNHPDLRLFKPLADRRRRRNGKFTLLYPGTLNQHQGLDIAIRALALVKDDMPDAELHIYGEGPARPDLIRLTEELQLTGRVKLFGRMPIADIAAVMRSADVGVVPKRADGFGDEAFSTKTLEFMACGVPVIVSRTRIDSYYFDDTLVRFFTSGDESDLARAFVDVYRDDAAREGRALAAREFAVRNSWQERVVDYVVLVMTMLRT